MKKEEKQNIRAIFDKDFTTLSQDGALKYGFLMDTIPDDIMADLAIEVEKARKQIEDNVLDNRFNRELAGEIEHEYTIEFTDRVEKYIQDLLHHFEQKSNGFIKTHFFHLPIRQMIHDGVSRSLKSYTIPSVKSDQPWVNFQSKYEYNPMHNHSGIMSLVIWYDIPYDIEDERKNLLDKFKYKRDSNVGSFSFIYDSGYGDGIPSHLIPVDKKFNGTICVFPSRLQHQVQPFYTSDEFRITISTNYFFDDIYGDIKKFTKALRNEI